MEHWPELAEIGGALAWRLSAECRYNHRVSPSYVSVKGWNRQSESRTQQAFSTCKIPNPVSKAVRWLCAIVIAAHVIEELVFRGGLNPAGKQTGFQSWLWGTSFLLRPVTLM